MPIDNPQNWLDAVPFVGLVTRQANGPQSPLFTRLAEAAVIGAVTTWGTVQVLGERIEQIERRLGERLSIVEHRVDKITGDVYVPRGAPR